MAMRTGALRSALTASVVLFSMSGAASAAFTGDHVIFVASPPLYAKAADGSYYRFYASIDNKQACGAEGAVDAQDDDGWICKSGEVTAGKHSFTVRIVFHSGPKTKTHAVQGVLNLRADAKGIEYPDDPSSGEQYWCVLVSKTKLTLMSKSAVGCHTD
ncbi:MAG: hypothetical protein HY243_11030 [Proteobacteria bacterium]|nr:hypothetical protein [Pseudomonadota bacterium]